MGVKISALPAIVTPALTDIFPVVQGGVTYKETCSQLSALIGGVVSGSIIGTANQIIVTPGVGNVTLSAPQDIALTSNVTFGSVAFGDNTKGIVGTATNDSAGAGYVGQFVSSVVSSGSAVSIATNTSTNLTSISLTAGDWDVWGNLTFLPANTTVVFNISSWLSSTSATLPDASLIETDAYGGLVFGVGGNAGSATPSRRFSLSGTTTVYLTGFSTFTTSTMTMCGGIYARRAR